MLSEYLRIGQVLRPVGIRGSVKVRPETDNPERFLGLGRVFLPDGEGYREAAVEEVSLRDGFVVLRLNGAADREGAEAQRGLPLYVPRAEAVPLPKGRYFISELIGCAVEDEEGRPLGTLADILPTGARDVYAVDTPEGRLLFPAIEKVILQVDIPAQRIRVDRGALLEVSILED